MVTCAVLASIAVAEAATVPVAFLTALYGLRHLARLEPGQFVTATSPHRPNDAAEAVSDMRPYNEVG